MPQTRKHREVKVLVRTSGWEVQKPQKRETNEQTAHYMISSIPAPQPPSTCSTPAREADTAAASTGTASKSSLVLARLLEQPAEDTAGARSDEKQALQGAAHGQETTQCPATIALLPNGRISGL